MFRISKRFRFCAAHQLLDMPDGHQCRRLHGHNYEVEVVLRTSKGLPPTGDGMVLDYGELSMLVKPMVGEMDHKFLAKGDEPILRYIPSHEVYFLHAATTAEQIANHLYQLILLDIPWGVSLLQAVRVSETPNTWAEYRGGSTPFART